MTGQAVELLVRYGLYGLIRRIGQNVGSIIGAWSPEPMW
ncbi:unnamed protein product [[Actinomadura] parvosata subsp. kistnae]|nr:unnamed protein product [Actinomadura parvosata subsp. kistnae]